MRRIPRGFAVPIAGLRLAQAIVLAAAIPVSAQSEADPPPPDTGPLARFVPQENLVLLLEFTGLDQHSDAWTNSAAYKVLNETSTGAMLAELVQQAAHVGTASNAERRVGGNEALDLLEHIARHGAVMGVTGPIEGFQGDSHGVVVVREAATQEARPLFGRLLAEAMGPEAKPEASERGGRRVVEYTSADSDQRRAWWAEGGHLFFTEAKDLDLIFGVLDGTIPNAVEHPLRAELSARDGAFEPVGWMFLDFERFPAGEMPQGAQGAIQQLGLGGLQRIDYRWGFEGPATMGLARVVAPEPRSGLLALADQPTFGTGDLPPIPAEAESFTVVSFDPLPVYDRITKLITDLQPEARSTIESLETQVKGAINRDLRGELLGTIGPRAALYFMPEARPSSSGLNPLDLAASTSIQVPRAALLVELKDRQQFSRTLDELMIRANQFLEEQTPSLAAMVSGETPPPPGGQEAEAPRPARFRLVSPDPKIYILQLPPQLGSAINLNLTIAVGERHLIVSRSTDLAREALALEESEEGRWSPSGELASTFNRLPGSLTVLQVNDTRQTLPEALANLPATVETIATTLADAREAAERAEGEGVAASADGPPGASPDGGRRGRLQAAAPGGSSAGMRSPGGPGGPGGPPPGYPGSSSGMMSPGGPGGPPPGYPGSSSGMMSPGGPGGPPPGYPGASSAGMSQGGPGGPPGQQADEGPPTLQLDPSKAPDADEVRRLLFPGSLAVSVDAEGIQITTRSAFPNVASPSGGIVTALLMPAIQSAREAAQRASGVVGSLDGGFPPPGGDVLIIEEGSTGLEPGRAWTPDPALVARLQPQEQLPEGLKIRIPQGFTRLEPAGEPPDAFGGGTLSQVISWQGPARPDGSRPRIDVLIGGPEQDDQVEADGAPFAFDADTEGTFEVMAFIGASGGGLGQLGTGSETEKGQVGGAPSLRDVWTGTTQDGRTKLHGFTYLTTFGDLRVGVSGLDSSDHNDAFALMEASALTLGK